MMSVLNTLITGLNLRSEYSITRKKNNKLPFKSHLHDFLHVE